MNRHIVTYDSRTFQQLAQDFAAQGIIVDHFHTVLDAGDQVLRLHLNKQPDGSFAPKRGAAPSACIADYTSVIADEWHRR